MPSSSSLAASSSSYSYYNLSSSVAQKYFNIAQAAMNDNIHWPEADKIRSFLDMDTGNKKYIPPTFDDGHGPIGLFSLVHRNKIAKEILKDCSAAFDQLCHELHQICKAEEQQSSSSLTTSQEPLDKYILRSNENLYHITICMFQEHPKLLSSDEEKKAWKPIDTTQEQLLLSKLSEYQSQYCSCVTLRLHSLLLTPDGAMIAGFIEDGDNSNNNYYEHIKSSSLDVATPIVGGQTTRSKDLIHVTIGRIVGMPTNIREMKQPIIKELVRKYNTKILPPVVDGICQDEESKNSGKFVLDEVSLLRNKIWLLEDYIEYGSWKLQKRKEGD